MFNDVFGRPFHPSLAELVTLTECVCHCVSNQGAPESVLERCTYIRVSGSARVPLTPAVREQLLSTLRDWGSGRDMLRCLAMATRDAPPDLRCLNLENTAAFVQHEVRIDEVCPVVLQHWVQVEKLN